MRRNYNKRFAYSFTLLCLTPSFIIILALVVIIGLATKELHFLDCLLVLVTLLVCYGIGYLVLLLVGDLCFKYKKIEDDKNTFYQSSTLIYKDKVTLVTISKYVNIYCVSIYSNKIKLFDYFNDFDEVIDYIMSKELYGYLDDKMKSYFENITN